MTMYPKLVADIGGTNARFAIANSPEQDLNHIEFLACADFPTVEDAIKQYLSQHKEAINSFSFAVAGPIEAGVSEMTNNHWRIDVNSLSRHYPSLQEIKLLNDFEALAHFIPYLDNTHSIPIGGGKPGQNSPIAVLGPGTGLGVALIVHNQNRHTVIATEGGHASLAPSNDIECDIFNDFNKQNIFCDREAFLCGSGITNIHQSLQRIAGKKTPVALDPASIVQSAMNTANVLEYQTLDIFCSLLGTAAADQAISSGAKGGVYIAGGIVPRFQDYFAHSSFRDRFERPGPLNNYLKSIPTYLVTHNHPGLCGAAIASC